MNDNAALYATHNHLQRTDANYALGTYSNLIKFQNDEIVLDVGSAGGDLTSDILTPRLPPNFEKVIGLDISDNMVNFANNRYRSNPRVSFSQMDISSKSPSVRIPRKFRSHFLVLLSQLGARTEVGAQLQ
jgi:trans-aconitate methyltransferase